MKIFAIKNRFKKKDDLAYLLYYERSRTFYIEILQNIDETRLPMILSDFYNKGEYTINSYWSKIWVQQRIIPPDRQNLGQILKYNKLKYYDEYQLLKLSKGYCSQDDCYISALQNSELPEEIQLKLDKKIQYVFPINNYNVIVFFKNNTAKICNLKNYGFTGDEFSHLRITPGGYGITGNGNIIISEKELRDNGKDFPITIDDFKLMIKNGLLNTEEASEISHCSRQNINDLVKRGKLHPIVETPKNKLFFKDEIISKI